MLILLPASKGQRSVRRGKPPDPAELSFPSLTTARNDVLDALIEVSGDPDATIRLGEKPTLADVVGRNVALRDAPTASVESVYSGVLYDALKLADLDPAARRRARPGSWSSPRCGGPCAWVTASSRTAWTCAVACPAWRTSPTCGGDRWTVCCPPRPARASWSTAASAEYLTAWRPTGALAERTVLVKAVREGGGGQGAASHNAKRTRGLVVRRIVTDGLNPRRARGTGRGAVGALRCGACGGRKTRPGLPRCCTSSNRRRIRPRTGGVDPVDRGARHGACGGGKVAAWRPAPSSPSHRCPGFEDTGPAARCRRAADVRRGLRRGHVPAAGGRAGLKPQLVHYYFRTMDDLFVEAFRRQPRRTSPASKEPSPRTARWSNLWRLNADPRGATFSIEFVALANHRKAIRPRSPAAERFRAAQVEAVGAALASHGVDEDEMPPWPPSSPMTGLAQVLASRTPSVYGGPRHHRRAHRAHHRPVCGRRQAGTSPRGRGKGRSV